MAFYKTYIFIFSGLIGLSACSSKKTIVDLNKPQYDLVWADEFDGNAINLDNWSFEIWDAGRVNNEWQKYVENTDNYKVENGILSITATQTGEHKKGGYTATRLSSQKKQEFKYGRIEFRAKMPQGKGTWPALWMLGSNRKEVGWPKCGEIDIMEYVGYQPKITHTNIHTKSENGTTNNKTSISILTAESEFHIYGIIWTPDTISFYIDSPNNIKNTYSPIAKNEDNWPFDQPFYLIMNFAVGGSWGGREGVDESIWPQTMEVDYVRVFQLKQ